MDMTIKVKERIAFYESLKGASEKKAGKSIHHLQSSGKSKKVNLETIDKVDEYAKEVIGEYRVYHREDSNKTYLIHSRVVERDPLVSEVIRKAKRVSQKQKIEPDERKRKIDEMLREITKRLVIKDGRLMRPYFESGATKYYDTGMTPKSLSVLLEQVCRVEDVETRVFHLIGEESEVKGKFLSISRNESSKDRCIVHIGVQIGRGGAGKIHKVWNLNNNRVLVLKKSFGQDLQKILERKTSLDIEASHLKKINPKGRCNGLQRAPYLVFRMSSRSSSFVGLLSARYDSDLSAALSPVDMEGNENKNKRELNLEQMIDGAHQIFSGIIHLNRSKILNADIKSSNIFIRQRSNGKLKFHISDFDQAVFLNDDLYRSEHFARDPVGGFSVDSLKINHQRWAEKTAKAIVLRLEALQMSSKQRAKVRKKLKKNKVKSKLEKEKIEVYKAKTKVLEEELIELKRSFSEIAFDIHTVSGGHILFQMLSSELSYDIDDIDFAKLERKVNFSDKERDLYRQLVDLCVRCLPEIEEAPEVVNLEHFYHPIGISVDECLNTLEEISGLR
ncbi:putative serine/threonine protein kinase [Waddlia chondrophila WSU 86-1044]|uniref:Putative serine/threonine protein kinase n=2 Tax=Waddlia chondrophila TaxID=71667 RepID=D6YTV9_WADCW|nr:putative serine/threonine protein kinase [Waddlia chondrophila WSU 86-1044]